MTKAIILDCFGVLYVNAGRLFYETQIPNYDSIKDTLHDLDRQADYGLITQDDLIESVADLSGLDKTFVRDNIQGEHRLNKPLLEFVQSLRPQYKLGMLSNISPGSMEHFFAVDERERYFDAVVLSGEVGTIKPNPEIYQIMAERLGILPGDCLMIDDSKDNCYGADAAGMKWIHYSDNTHCISEIRRILQVG